MATLEQIAAALRKADAAGNTEDAKKLVAAYRAAQATAAPVPVANDAGDGGHVGQALSGVYEGGANLLGFGTDLVKDALSVGPTIVNALGGDAKLPDYIPDTGAAAKQAMESAGLIREPSGDPSKQFVRRVGQEVGATLIPGLGLAAKAAAPIRFLGAELASAASSGSAAAASEQLLPGNEAAEMTAQVLGGLTPWGLGAMMRRSAAQKAAPSVEELKDEAGDLYEAARNSGVKSTQPMNQMLYADMETIARDEGLISPTGRVSSAYPKVGEVLRTFDDYAKGDMSVRQMQTVRQTLQDAAMSPERGERRIAMKMMDAFDAHTTKLAPELAEANSIYTRAKQGEMIDLAVELAGIRAGQFSGSGFENALRTEFRQLERDIAKGRIKGLPEDVEKGISLVAQGGTLENAARWLGKFAPSGNVSTTAGAALGYTMGNVPGALAVLGAGAAGRGAATAMTAGNAAKVSALARRGRTLGEQSISDDDIKSLGGLSMGQVANQNEPREVISLREYMTAQPPVY